MVVFLLGRAAVVVFCFELVVSTDTTFRVSADLLQALRANGAHAAPLVHLGMMRHL